MGTGPERFGPRIMNLDQFAAENATTESAGPTMADPEGESGVAVDALPEAV